MLGGGWLAGGGGCWLEGINFISKNNFTKFWLDGGGWLWRGAWLGGCFGGAGGGGGVGWRM